LRSLAIDRDTVLDADVCVVGSGAGGGVAAALLAQAGRRVVVLEAGGWYTEADFSAEEESGWERLYMRRGALATDDAGMLILAGRTLGGGTTVNWTTCFRPPAALLAEWAARSGVAGLQGDALQASYAAVEARMGIHIDDGPFNGNNAVVWNGAAALGLVPARNPRNTTHCGTCGICHFGCRWGAKQGTMRTYLQDAYDAGAQIVPNCYADRVLLMGDRVVGVAARVRRPVEERVPDAPAHRLTVRAPVVVVAGGALESPALLLRSGLRHPAIGRNLYLHPATGVIGRFDTPVEAWRGPMQDVYSNALADLTGDGYGVRFEAVPLFPGFAAITAPWTGGRAFRAYMGGLAHYNALLVLTRDRVPGRVVLDSQGRPRLLYRPSAESRRLLLRGCQEGARVVLAAGAREAQTLHTVPLRVRGMGGLDRFQAEVAAAGAAPNRMTIGSAHQMGTCRMDAHPARGVVDGRGAVHGVRGLYVCDTSIFPSASGVNPMLTALGLAHWVVQGGLLAGLRGAQKGRPYRGGPHEGSWDAGSAAAPGAPRTQAAQQQAQQQIDENRAEDAGEDRYAFDFEVAGQPPVQHVQHHPDAEQAHDDVPDDAPGTGADQPLGDQADDCRQQQIDDQLCHCHGVCPPLRITRGATTLRLLL
jgi:choline dehydrogenase-like flavoprotein